jgi:hypothetical protein
VGRHATLRAAIDWSYELLAASEQRLLARLAVFSGGCTLEAIEEVCSGDPVDRDAVLDLLTGLVTRSLVIAEEHATGTRYRLLETIRQYAEQRLAEHGDTELLRGRHSGFYARLCAGFARGLYHQQPQLGLDTDLLVVGSRVSGLPQGASSYTWTRRIGIERDNIRSGLANAIEAGDVAGAVEIVANHPRGDRVSVSTLGQVFSVAASRIVDMPGAAEHPEFPRVLMVAAYEALDSGDNTRADTLSRQALEAADSLHTPLVGPPIEVDALTLRAEASLAAGAYGDAVEAYARAAELALAAGYPGIAAIFLAYTVSSALLGGLDVERANSTAEQAMTLARQSEMPGAIVIALNCLALTLVDVDPKRALALLHESVDRSTTPGQEIAPGFVTASLVAGLLRHWTLALTLAGRAMYLYRGIMNPLHSAPCLAECARALAEDRPEVAGVLQGAAYAAFRRAIPAVATAERPAPPPAGTSANFVLQALRETGELVVAALGDERARELRRTGVAMGVDEAVSYALANIDPKLITGPVASIDR